MTKSPDKNFKTKLSMKNTPIEIKNIVHHEHSQNIDSYKMIPISNNLTNKIENNKRKRLKFL